MLPPSDNEEVSDVVNVVISEKIRRTVTAYKLSEDPFKYKKKKQPRYRKDQYEESVTTDEDEKDGNYVEESKNLTGKSSRRHAKTVHEGMVSDKHMCKVCYSDYDCIKLYCCKQQICKAKCFPDMLNQRMKKGCPVCSKLINKKKACIII